VDAEAPLAEPLREELRSRDASLTESAAVIPVEEPAREIPEVLEIFRRHGAAVRDLTLKSASLEDVFLHLTGRELRE
jgi:ABC-2 type transport system ATP-binding protein